MSGKQVGLSFLVLHNFTFLHISSFSGAAFWNFAGSAICGIYVES